MTALAYLFIPAALYVVHAFFADAHDRAHIVLHDSSQGLEPRSDTGPGGGEPSPVPARATQ
jgi:hypothetical protein